MYSKHPLPFKGGSTQYIQRYDLASRLPFLQTLISGPENLGKNFENKRAVSTYIYTHTHTHTYIYIYVLYITNIYLYIILYNIYIDKYQ